MLHLIDLKEREQGRQLREGMTDSESSSHVRLTESSEIWPHRICKFDVRESHFGGEKGGKKMPNVVNQQFNRRFISGLPLSGSGIAC